MDKNELIESKVVNTNLTKSDVTDAVILIANFITEAYKKGEIDVIEREVNVLNRFESLKVA